MTYVVKAHCCTSGNCTTCQGGFDKSRRRVEVVNPGTTSRERAESIQRAWSDYGAFIEEKEGDPREATQ